MRVTGSVEDPGVRAPVTAADRPATPRRYGRWRDLAAALSFLALAVLVLSALWADPAGRVLRNNVDDHGFFMFVLAHGERVVFGGEHPLLSTLLNVPDGVNMMANTSVLALSIPVAPVTHYFGAGVSVVLLLTLGLAGTAAAWYVVLGRWVRSRAAAYVGGLWCGFAPTMVSHANGHINFVAQFVVPFIVWRVLALRTPGRAVRNGVALGLLVVLQVFLNEEVLLFTALGCAAFVAGYAALDRVAARAAVRPMLAGLGVTAAVSTALLAYPLWFQFFGPGHYRGQPFTAGEYVTDLLAFGAYARQSLAGDAGYAERLSVSATEDNAFFGVPLLIMIVVAVVLLRRSVPARATAITGGVLAVMGLGPSLQVNGEDTGIALPFALIGDVPIIDLVSVTRFTMVTATVVGILLALAADRMAGVGFGRRARTAFWVALIAALLPVAPRPLPVEVVAPLPTFLSAGLWRPYVPAGRTLVPVPLPEVTTGRDGMRWAALSGLRFPVPRGYFMGPAGPPGDVSGSWSAPRRPTADLLREVSRDGRSVAVSEADRRAAAADLAYWRAGVLVLVGHHPHAGRLATTVSDLLGRRPQQVADVLIWDVRDLPVTG